MPSSNSSGSSSFLHTSIPTTCPPTSQSDRGSSSGVSSLGDPERPRPTIPQPTIVSDDSNHSTQSHSTPVASKPPNYKFKSSIKQRFSAERIKSHTPPITEKPHGVPIFALHDGGAFYIPLTVESELLRPHLTFTPDTGPDMVLHPVTISVNFNHSAPPAWSHHSPTYQQTWGWSSSS